MKQRFVRLVSIVLLAGAVAALSAQEQLIQADNTNTTAPLVDAAGGLAKALIDYLNADMRGEYRFVLVNLPRKSFDDMIRAKPSDFRGVGLFLSPDFVPGAKRFLWSGLLYDDAET